MNASRLYDPPDPPGLIARRWTERPSGGHLPEDRAAALLQKLDAVPPLGPVALRRIEARLQEAEARGRRPLWLAPAGLALGAAGLALVVGYLARHPLAPALRPAPPANVEQARLPAAGPRPDGERLAQERPAPKEVTARDGEVVRSGDGDGAHLVLVGPGAASLDPTAGPLALHEGRLLVRAGRAGVAIAVPFGRVLVRPGGLAEIEIRERRVRVAAFVGGSDVEWRAAGDVVAVAPGTMYTEAGVTAAPPGRRQEVEGLLSGVGPAALADPQDPVERPAARDTEVRHKGARRESPAIQQDPGAAAGDEAAASAPAGYRSQQEAQEAQEAPGATAQETALMTESRLLAVALRQLQKEGDAAAALASLDAYQARFPKGTLGPEARKARVDALLRLGRRGRLLLELDPMSLHEAGGRDAELLVIRGELRAAAGRCGDALSDFTAALGGRPRDELGERALYGRASCRARLGDTAGARGDLSQYLARFPGGRFADAARETLGK